MDKIKTMQLNKELLEEKTEFVYKKENINIRYLNRYKLLIQTWTKFVKSEDFRQAIDFTVEFATQNQVNYIISDALKQAAIRPEDSAYAASVMPELVKSGLIAFAFVIPEDIFTKLALKKFSDMEGTDHVQYFWEFEEALTWINNFGKKS